jgi:hypothetical protein
MTDRSLASIPPIVRAAIEAGHEPSIEHLGKRFRVVCSCGWKTPLRASRKAAFLAITEHVDQVGRPILRDTPTSIPGVVGGRA